MKISTNTVVEIDYTLTNDSGEVVDTSKGNEPLVYIQGIEAMVPGLENALEGKEAGASLQVKVEPKDGYGEHEAELEQIIPKDSFEDPENIEEGIDFQIETPDGGARMATIIKIDGNDIHIDMNHPFAGMNLNFDVTVLSVREAAEDELSHGHIHGEGCNH